ncbi:MAG: putative copper-exporting P-type ATPase V [Phycisphaerae bacterium]|nr:putative copper-exporting P-type ATPase V [Phycisphaerae bacterium]
MPPRTLTGESHSAAGFCAHCNTPVRRGLFFRPVQRGDDLFCCYGCAVASLIVGQTGEGGRASWLLARFAFGVFLAMNVMLFSALLYWPEASGLPREYVPAIRKLVFGLATPAMVVLVWPFVRNTVAQLRRGRAGMDSLIAVGSLAAYGYSTWSVFGGGGQIYFETATMLLVLVTLGKFLEASARARTADAIERLTSRTASVAHRLDAAGQPQDIAPADLSPGDRIRVLVGECLPADGRLVAGATELDESILTGESRPVSAEVGRLVLAGSTNLGAPVEVEVTTVGADTVARQIERMMDIARASRPAIARLTDRITEWFTPAVVVTATAGGAWWWVHADPVSALRVWLAVLVVACPCALGIAIPVAGSVALGWAAARGLLVRSIELFEGIGRVRTACFDKTGTLTRGCVSLTATQVFAGSPANGAEARALAAAVEAHSEHPLARAFSSGDVAQPPPAARCDFRVADVQVIRGGGLAARETARGWDLLLGSRSMLSARGVATDAVVGQGGDEGIEVLLAIDGALSARFLLADEPRPESAAAVASLRAAGVNVVLLSGDRTGVCRSLAGRVGIDEVHGDLPPGGKLAEMERIRAAGGGPIAMIGDGINDAPALGGADLAIAVNSARDLLRLNADVCLVSEDLRLVPALVRLGRRTRRVMRENLAWAFAYNIAAIPVALSGWLHPLVAAGAMVLSSLMVVANSMRLARSSHRGAEGL